MVSGNHDGHDIAHLTSASHDGGAVGRRVCLDCEIVVGVLMLCGQRTKDGKPCCTPVRSDLGHTVCWPHGEGRGQPRTSRRRAS